jgi:hypothetical protein
MPGRLVFDLDFRPARRHSPGRRRPAAHAGAGRLQRQASGPLASRPTMRVDTDTWDDVMLRVGPKLQTPAGEIVAPHVVKEASAETRGQLAALDAAMAGAHVAARPGISIPRIGLAGNPLVDLQRGARRSAQSAPVRRDARGTARRPGCGRGHGRTERPACGARRSVAQ